MSNFRAFIKGWLPVIAWMAVIHLGSTPVGSTQNSSRIIGPILRWFHPGVSEQSIHHVQVVARKGAHLAEYAILAALIWRARRLRVVHDAGTGWDARTAGFCIGLSAAYAVLDEFHQSFVPGRDGTIRDVLIDSVGACCGILLIWFIGHRRGRW